jgi:hypothetical protein
LSPLRRIAATSRLGLLALVLSAPIALVPHLLHAPGLGGAIGLPGLGEFAGEVRAALPALPTAHHHTASPAHGAAPRTTPAAATGRHPVAAGPSGRRLQSVVTASCAGCTVVKDRASGALRATVSRATGAHAYAVVDMGTQHATLAVRDRLALGAGQVPTHSVDVLQVTDADNRVVYRLVVAAHTRLLSFVSPPGALSAQGVSASTRRRVPNDGRTKLDVSVVTRANGFVTVGIDGTTVLSRTGLQGGVATQQRYVAAGILHSGQAGLQLTVVHDSLVVSAPASQPVAVTATALTIAATPTPPPPANVSSPSVTGTPYDGATLTLQPGTWTGADTVAVRWSRCDPDGTSCSAIDGATGSSYTPGQEDVGSALRATVTASNAHGSAPAATALTPVVAGATPVSLAPPEIGGAAIQGGALKFVPGTWRWKTGSSTYRWQRCDATGASCDTIDAAPTSQYLLAAQDVGSTFRLVVTVPGYAGSATVTSAPTAVVVPSVPVNAAVPAVSGSLVVGSTLTASTGTWSDPQPALTYAWSRCAADGTSCAAVAGAAGATYAITAADVGSTLVVAVTGGNVTGSATASSAPTAVVPAPPSVTAAPGITGDAVDGSTLIADLGSWSDPAAALSVAWLRCDPSGACVAIDGAVSGTYTLTDADVGDTIEIAVTATGATGTGTASSAPTGPVGPTPPPPPPPPVAPAIVTPPTISGDATVGSTLTAVQGAWSDAAANLTLAWERCDATGTTCAPIDGATGDTYVVTQDDLGSTLEAVSSATNAGGTASAASSPSPVVSDPAAAGGDDDDSR